MLKYTDEEKIDFGQKFGFAKSSDFNKLYHQYNMNFLKLLANKINKQQPKIADYGGGNGIISSALTGILKRKNIKDFKIDIIDLDSSKFIGNPYIRNIKSDVLAYNKKEYYDFSISRFLMHYFIEKEKKEFFMNVYNNLKESGYFLLINWVIDDIQTLRLKSEILGLIQNFREIKPRSIPTSANLIENAKKAGFKIERKMKVSYTISLDDFYRNRFNLTRQEINMIKNKVKTTEHKELQIALLLKK